MTDRSPADSDALERARQAGHELRDANYLRVALCGVGLLVLLATALVSMYGLAVVLGAHPPLEQPRVQQSQVMSSDQIGANQRLTRLRLEQSLRKTLDSYGWVDRDHGVAHIPIDRSIDVLAERETLSPSWGEDSTTSQGSDP